MEAFSIYIHIPFCMKKCGYCDFLSFESREQDYEAYVVRLCEEIASAGLLTGSVNRRGKLAKDKLVPTVFVGGGTPTVLTPQQLKRIFDCLKKNFRLSDDCEVTVEANPETLTDEKAEVLRASGVNRLSIGLQSADNKLLRTLGRIHNYERFAEAFEYAKKIGFNNINVDLMFGLPGQTAYDWEKTLETVIGLKPEHISCYSLMLEEGSDFGKRSDLMLTGEDEERDMYYRAKKLLGLNGYEQYEISNFSKAGFECRHNLVYWTLKDYISFGLGAHSYSKGLRFQNTAKIDEYLSGDFSRREVMALSAKDKYSEFMFLGLRLNRGVSAQAFKDQFNMSMDRIFGAKLRELSDKKLLSYDGETAVLTEKGIDLSNIVFSEMLLD